MRSHEANALPAAEAEGDALRAALRRNWRTVASTDNLQLLDDGETDAMSLERLDPAARRRLLLQAACLCGAGAGLLGLAAVTTLAKLLPPSGIPLLAALQQDSYYCYLVPLMLPVTCVAVTANWFSLKLFKHNS